MISMRDPRPAGFRRMESASGEKGPDADAVYRLKVTVRDSRPPIWRKLQVAAGMSLNELHQVLQIVMGWERHYSYQFDDGLFWYGQDFVDDLGDFVPGGEDDTKTRLCDVANEEGAHFLYNYRLEHIFLEGIWALKIRIERILPSNDELRVPLCVGGRRAGPPEAFPGIWNYEACLLSLRNSGDPRHQEAREALGPEFDPDAFNLSEINGRLATHQSLQGQPQMWQRQASEVLESGRPPIGGRWVYGTRSRKR
jgi:Plasmid pRiA4b ORF-3-like protein